MARSRDDIRARLLATFRVEADEHLQALTATLLALGRGLPEAEARQALETTFREVHTLKGAARSVSLVGEGTGLGLPICRGIIEGHGGTLGVTSEPGRGAVFVVDLPAGTVKETAAPDPAAEPAPRAGARAILVVDDEEDVRELVVDLLSTDGHRADAVPNGLAALDALRERSYDVIISDARMPGLGGAGLYRRLQAERPELARRFILMTGDAMTTKTREFIEEARVVSLAKPFALDEMRRAIRQVLGAG